MNILTAAPWAAGIVALAALFLAARRIFPADANDPQELTMGHERAQTFLLGGVVLLLAIIVVVLTIR
ncbi:MAG: hypothetical protein WCF84_05890 [Anaerolineae bacterium]